jgi:hypothetical protein
VNEDEERDKINYPLPGLRLEPKAVSMNQSCVATDPLDRFTVILKEVQIF